MNQEEEAGLIEEIQHASTHDHTFAVLLSLLMLARPERELMKRVHVVLEGRNLVGVQFKKRNLSGISFRHGDLSHAVFQDCDLRGVLFEGAFFHRTRFEGETQLQDAQFDDLARVQSLFIGRKFLDDPVHIREWAETKTGRVKPAREPCPTALQIQHLFGKFITPLGDPRRDDLKRDALIAGKRYGGAAATEVCIDEAASDGYLTGPDFRNRFRRAEGDKYAEMVKLVREGSVSDGLGRIISRLCRRRGCIHQIHS